MSNLVKEIYDPAMRDARARFAASPALRAFLSEEFDPTFWEMFLIQFSSLGVALTTPVEDWLIRSSRRCAEVGLPELAQALRSHSKQEAGHQNMMIHDTHALVKRWNARHENKLDAKLLLERPPTAGGCLYRKLHEDTIVSETPYAQIAIEYEIEMLPVQFGPLLLQKVQNALGEDVLPKLSFLTEHIELDVKHTEFNALHLERLLQRNRAYLPELVKAGRAALEAYAAFLQDCVRLARENCRIPIVV
jgi:hypothetical protein